MAWQVLGLALAVVAVAALAPSPVQELPAPQGSLGLVVPAPDGSQRNWSVYTEAPAGPAAQGFAAGVAMMQGVRGTLVTTHDPEADIVVRWHRELRDGARLGQHLIGTPHIDVGLGDDRCGGWRAYDMQTIKWVVAHEIGHAMGLPHGHEDSLMSPHLPVSYVEACLVADGHASLGPRQKAMVPITLGSIRTVQYTVEADRPIDVCITPALAAGLTGWACQDGVRIAAGEVTLPPGDFHLRLRCDAWVGSCQAMYELSTR